MKPNPESVYLEPSGVFLLDRSTGAVRAPLGVTIHWKEGTRWQHLTLLPDEGEDFASLLGRLGTWIEDDPQGWTTGLLGTGRMASGDSERVR